MLKKPINILLLSVGVIYALTIFGKSSAAKNLKIVFKGIKFLKSKTGSIPYSLQINFQVFNPSSFPITINSIFGDLKINGQSFATVNQLQAMQIPANTISNFPVNIDTGITTILQTVYNLINGAGGKKIELTFSGSVRSSGFIIPINQTLFKA